VRLQHAQLPEEARELDKELRALNKEKDAAVRGQDFEKAGSVNPPPPSPLLTQYLSPPPPLMPVPSHTSYLDRQHSPSGWLVPTQDRGRGGGGKWAAICYVSNTMSDQNLMAFCAICKFTSMQAGSKGERYNLGSKADVKVQLHRLWLPQLIGAYTAAIDI
jgi:hypothetical protein